MALRLIAPLQRATHQVGLYIHRELSEIAISPAEAHVLSLLSARDPCSIADVHRSFGHRRSTLTSILDRLEDRGLIAREIHPDDRRSVLLRLTPEGRPLAGKARRTLERLEAGALSCVGEPQVAAFIAVIEAIRSAAEEE
jgi:MarR family multiple antibiotic resistance transcriptional regulator